jgi:putative transposase
MAKYITGDTQGGMDRGRIRQFHGRLQPEDILIIALDFRLKGEDVVAVIDHLKCLDRTPMRIQVDNGSEFISKALDRWAYENRVTLDFSRPGKPTDNATIESFNGSFRDECLNLHWFLSLEDAQEKIERLENGVQRIPTP